MVCTKCGYQDANESIISGHKLCSICKVFAPSSTSEESNLESYISEKIDWKYLDTFRKFQKLQKFSNQKQMGTMTQKASEGKLMNRPPLGYTLIEGKLVQNEDASRVHSLFKTFLSRKYSLNSLAKNFSLSINGIKKILSNRAYLGETKFMGRIYKGNHEALISPEIFYAVQRKLQTYLKPRKST